MSSENILKGCLVESDPQRIARARQAKRRALVVAIILQVLLVGLLVLAPLLGATERLPNNISFILCPPVPYKGSPKASEPKPSQPERGPRKPPPISAKSGQITFRGIPEKVAEVVDPPDAFNVQPTGSGSDNVIGDPNGLVDLSASSNRSAAPPKPAETSKPKETKSPIEVPPAVQEARLIHRVEPKYPTWLKSAGIEGKVVLRAVIARDGTVQSLEVVSGNPLFIDVSREAILQWRYQPTLLHGEPVEVETFIMVIFILRK